MRRDESLRSGCVLIGQYLTVHSSHLLFVRKCIQGETIVFFKEEHFLRRGMYVLNYGEVTQNPM